MCPDDVVKEELRKIGKSRKNQDRRIRVHGNYKNAIGGGYKYPPLPPFHSRMERRRERKKREKEKEGREKEERKKGSSGRAGSRIEIVEVC